MLLIDANQVWDVDEAIDWTLALKDADPFWIEEPTSPDDILGHARIAQAVRPIRVATGEHCHNRVMFKQFFQADAIDIAQIDGCRLGGVNEVLAVLLLAAKFGVPVCPHAGGIGLVPARAALLDVRLAARVGALRRPHDRVRRPPARALRHRARRPRRPLHRAHRRRLRTRDEAGVGRGLRVPRRRYVGH